MEQYTLDALARETADAGRVFDLPSAALPAEHPEALPSGEGDLRRLLAEAVRAASAGQVSAEQTTSGRQSVVLELDRAQFARAVYRSNSEERRRVGARLTEGGGGCLA